MLVQKQITDLKLVQPCDPDKNLKNSTCDLTVGEIFEMGGAQKLDSRSVNEVWLEPSCMVAVRTTEKLVLPSNVTGLATLVTSLTHEGILCLNVGIIDPGYDGHLSAFLVNFSRRPRKISLSDRLFRVVFFEHQKIEDVEVWVNPRDEYSQFLQNKANNEFASTFLDVAGVTALAEKSAWKIVAQALISKWLPIGSFAVAIISVIIALTALTQTS